MDAQPDGVGSVTLAVVEALDRDGHVRLAVPVRRWPVTLGRAVDCDVVLGDPYAAARHATLADRDGVLTLVVGETVNGVSMTRQKLAAQQTADLPSGEVFQVGHTRLRVRRAGDALPPERPLRSSVACSGISVLVLALAFSAWNVGEHWLDTDPGGRLIGYLPGLLGPLVALAAWTGLWSVGSKLVGHRFDFWPHANVAFRYMLVAGILALVLPLAAYSLGWTFLGRISGIASSSVVSAMVLAHLTLMLPSRRRALSAVVGALLVAGVSLFLVRNYQVHDRVFSQLYVTALGPPALRLAPAVAPARFIDEARALKAVLDAHARDEDGAGVP